MNLRSMSQHKIFNIVVGFLVLITIVVSLQSYSSGIEIRDGILRSDINNYLIFKTSATHLFQGLDLYKLHPTDHFDLFKYSPLFAMLMAPFTLLPDWLGVIFWNLLNLFVLIYGLKLLPSLSKKQVYFILLIGFFELVGTLMNEQSNALMTGLMVLGIAKYEKGDSLWGTFYLVLSVYIKLFSIVLFMMLLFYPNKIRTTLYTLMWVIIFTFLPIIITGWEGLIATYSSWLDMLQHDYDSSVGFSVVGVMVRWFNYEGSRTLVFGLGVLLMMLPLIKIKEYSKQSFRYMVFAALLIWIIIFNHKAESPTFIIATTGIGLYFLTNKLTLTNKILLIFTIVFVSLVYSDLMPRNLRVNFFHHYFIKAVPCIIIWLKIIFEITFSKQIPINNSTAKA